MNLVLKMWKRECPDCIYFEEGTCTKMDLEIIIGRMNVADYCQYYQYRKPDKKD